MTDKIRGLFTRSFTTKIESNRESQNQKTERSLSPSSSTNKDQPKSGNKFSVYSLSYMWLASQSAHCR